MSTDLQNVEPLGVLNICKPVGWTSRDAVNRVQRILGRKVKMGHAGTLDPMATGVLLVCVGRATRLIPLIHEYSKCYLASFRLGQTSDTDDSTGRIQSIPVEQPPPRTSVAACLQSQVGVRMQTPPAFSAVKVQGKRAYQSAREGQAVEIKPRPVTIHEIEILDYQYPELNVRVCCGSGTYIRSIARDLGEQLGTGGLMSALKRTRIGPFVAKESLLIDSNKVEFNDLTQHLQPVETLFSDWPTHVLDETQLQLLRVGKRLHLLCGEDRVVALTDENRFAAILERQAPDASTYRPVLNWVPAWFNPPG